MSYHEYYLSRKVAYAAGFGKKIWLLKLPRVANSPTGRDLLGSVVEDKGEGISDGPEYPVP